MMQHPITQRINFLLEKFSDGNVSKFASLLQLTNSKQVVNRLFHPDPRSGKYPTPSTDIITAILDAYPNVNPTWLVSGKGTMLLDEYDIKQVEPAALHDNTSPYNKTSFNSEADYWKNEYIAIQKKYTALLENKLEELFAIKRAAGI
jgi:hypothetical protein